ncbi:MAG: PAS domain-containing sensor histidine kinase [Gammaproteobacteria bacterium]
MQETANSQILEQAFAAFNQHSTQLERSFQTLQQQVAVLSDELAAANSDRLRQLREKEALALRLEKLLGALPGGIIVTDAQDTIVECNQTALTMLGGALIGECWNGVLARLNHDDSHGELQLPNGPCLSVSRRALANDDPSQGTIVLLSDVTEPRALQSMLARKQRLIEMGEMAARLAHQVRTPLSSALLYSSQLGRARVDDRKRQCYAQRIGTRLGQLERMVNDMLGFARGGTATSQDIEIDELLTDVVSLMEPQRREGDTLALSIEPGLRHVHGNRDALLGALTNLCTNALQASEPGVALTLTARNQKSGRVALGVRDTGPGLNPKDAEQIFNAFFTTRADGTGLGLAVVKSTAEAHGGDVSVDSMPGQGCHIQMHLDNPAHSAALPGAVAPRCAAACA